MDAVSLPDQPHGPYHQPPAETFTGFARRRQPSLAAPGGLELGAWYTRIRDWRIDLCDTPSFLAILGLLQRPCQASSQQGGQAG